MTDPPRDTAWQRYRDAGEQALRGHRFDEAEQQFLDALEQAERFGPEDPRLGETLFQLGRLYCGPGFRRPGQPQAAPLLQRALAIQEKALGPDHPDVAQSRLLLAQCYAGVGQPARMPGSTPPDFAAAESQLRRALAILERAAAPDHGLLKSTLEQLARLYEQQGRDAEAEAILRHAAALWERLAGSGHPFALNALIQRAQLSQKHGLLAE